MLIDALRASFLLFRLRRRGKMLHKHVKLVLLCVC